MPKSKPKASDLGSGMAAKAAAAAAKRNRTQKSALDSIMGQIKRQRKAQTTDSNN